ncbi:MAG TPA: hypothetical protein VH325_16770 [Bryobacteraceae bacterium]|jgi:hypothetical protein|nr:hypothetical protein [Bryobacteraceae bacterium]
MLKLSILVLALYPGQSGMLQAPASGIEQTVASGRAVTVAERADQRVKQMPRIAPGPPPALSFRLYEGKSHHRYGDNGLMLDDAGH